MAEFIKSKPIDFVNKPIGVVKVNTGAEQAANTLFQVASNVGAQMFQKAKENEIKKGKLFGLNVETRDADGNLIIQSVPPAFSDVASESADTVLRQRYANALNVDVHNELTRLRNITDITPEEFTSKASAYLSKTEQMLERTGGKDYINTFRDISAKYLAQHQNALVLKAAKKADEQAVNNELFLIDQNISILETKVANGDEFLDETEFQIEGDNIKLETYRDNIIANAYNLHTRNKISFAKYKEIENEINKTYSAAKLRHITDPMGKNLDLPAIIKVRKFLLDGKISEEEKIDLQKYDVNFDELDNLSRTNRDYLAAMVAKYGNAISQELSLLGKNNKYAEFVSKFSSNQIMKLSKTEEGFFDTYLAQKYFNKNTLNNSDIYAIGRTADGIQDMLRHNGLPTKVKTIFESLPVMLNKIQTKPSDANKKELLEQLYLFRNLSATTGQYGRITNESFRKNIGNDNFQNWLAIDTRLRVYGEENMAEVIQNMQSIPLDEQARKTQIQMNLLDYFGVKADDLSSPRTHVNKIVLNLLAEGAFGESEDFNPEALSFLNIIATNELSKAGTNSSVLQQVLVNSYNALYVESSLMWNTIQEAGATSYVRISGVGNRFTRSRFAPERYFGHGEELDRFKNYVNNKVNMIMQSKNKYKLGENIHLLATPQSGTRGGAQYQIVASDGQGYLLDPKDNDTIHIHTQGFMKKLQSEDNVKFLETLEKFKQIRLSRIRKEKKVSKDLDKSFIQQIIESLTLSPYGK